MMNTDKEVKKGDDDHLNICQLITYLQKERNRLGITIDIPDSNEHSSIHVCHVANLSPY